MGRMIAVKKPSECSSNELTEFAALVARGGEVAVHGLPERIANSLRLGFAVVEDKMVAVAAIKRPGQEYASNRFAEASSKLCAGAFDGELGWVFTEEEHRGKGLAGELIAALLRSLPKAELWATTRNANARMRNVLLRFGFAMEGNPFPGRNESLILMVKPVGSFPFGQPVRSLKQTECSPKKVFVLGVYASAVHAKWLNPQGKKVVEALAVASEPYIFWRGEDAEKHIPKIPKALGSLIPANSGLNGPSGIALDEKIIAPLGYGRPDCWLCDLVPHSCVNTRQRDAIRRAYNPLVKKFGLPEHSVPDVPKRLTDEKRREEIYAELVQSKAAKLVLLGNMPIKWFVHFYDKRWDELSDFLTTGNGYGKPVESKIGDLAVELIPLAHPRQAARLGASSEVWGKRHDEWMQRRSCGE